MSRNCASRVVKWIAIVLTGLAFLANGITAESAEKIMKFGAPIPLTGPLSPEGKKMQQGYDLWMDTANQKGGIKVGNERYRIQMLYYDYQSNTPRAVQIAEKLITDDKVNFLFSPFGSGATKAASGVSEKYGIPTVAPTASATAVYDQGYKYLFGVYTPDSTITDPLAIIVRQKLPKAKKIAILARNDLFPLAIANEMNASAKKQGFEVIFFEKYAIGTMDHASALTTIRSAKPDWVFTTGYINDNILILKQMGDLGVSADVVSMLVGPYAKEFIDATGPLSKNVTSASWWHPAVRYKGECVFGSTENYNRLFEAKHGSVPEYGHGSVSAAGAVMQLGIEKAGSLDPKKVRDALANLDAMTFWGPVKFGPTGQIISLKPPVFQIQEGKGVVIYPPEIRQSELRLGAGK